MEVKIFLKDNREEVLKELNNQTLVALEACGLKAERYAKMECPVKTGRLRNSIAHAVSTDLNAYIGTNVEYAPYVENGARGRAPKHFLKHAAENHADEYVAIIRKYLKG